ncbi:MAG TPA: SDR family oxidoreductase [Myxococcota bacterium]|nr:SDR family oxidoreductase [Myxococcota bacterium]
MAFHGRVALVTGAGSGIGRVAARRLAEQGAAVAAVDLNEAGLVGTARAHPGIRSFTQDVSDGPGVRALLARVESELGPLDRVVNAAAIMPTGLLLDAGAEELRRVMEVNYLGTVHVSLAALPGMLARGRGDLVNFASIAGWVPGMHFGGYNASKFAVVAFTEVLHHENRGRGVRILCACPGKVDTPMLAQAKSNPRMLRAGSAPIPPERVVEGVERALEAGRLLAFSDWQAAMGFRLRRFAPKWMWAIGHLVEGI